MQFFILHDACNIPIPATGTWKYYKTFALPRNSNGILLVWISAVAIRLCAKVFVFVLFSSSARDAQHPEHQINVQ